MHVKQMWKAVIKSSVFLHNFLLMSISLLHAHVATNDNVLSVA